MMASLAFMKEGSEKHNASAKIVDAYRSTSPKR